jgi:choline dehydrogenase-like flavoprotein
MAEVVEARTNGKRADIMSAYPLTGVTVLTDTLAKRVIKSASKIATGVELALGKVISAKQEVIFFAGAFRTPQLLMLSGVGPTSELKRHGVEEAVENNEVGKNL